MSDDVVTPAMRKRGLCSVAEAEQHARACASDQPLREFVAHRVAEHRARIAWAEVEYQAWRGGNCIGLIHRPLARADMVALLNAAYSADRHVHETAVALVNAQARRVRT